MKQTFLASLGVAVCAGAALAAPLTPTITSHDINFGAEFIYATNGTAPDTLVTSKDGANSTGEEATAYWPNWPSTVGVTPIWFNLGGAAAPQFNFGGDLRLGVKFTGHDETPPPLDVSLTGTGLYGTYGDGAADLEVWGYMSGINGQPVLANVLLWAVDLEFVSLYGYGNPPALGVGSGYVLEGVGKVVGGLIAIENNLVGSDAVMRGNIDLPESFATPGAIKGFASRYDPLSDAQVETRGSYSGETGKGFAIPEPAAIVLLGAGALLAFRRRQTAA